MALFRQLLPYLRPYRRKIYLTLLAMGMAALSTGIFALIIKNFVDDIFLPSKPGSLPTLIAIIVLVSIMAGISIYGQQYLANYVGQGMVRDLRKDLFEHILNFSPAYFSRTSSSQMLSRTTNDVAMIQLVLQDAVTIILKEGLTLLILVGVLFYRDWTLALISCFIFPIAATFTNRMGTKIKNLSVKQLTQLQGVTERVAETCQNLKLVQSFGRETFEAKRFTIENNHLFTRVIKIIKAQALSSPIMDIIRGLAFGLVLLVGSLQIKSASITPGTLASFGTALVLISTPLKRIAHFYGKMNEGLGAMTRVFEVLNTPTTIQNLPGARKLPPFKSSIQFEGIYFAYQKNWVLQDISFAAKAGDLVALVGPSGAGKTSIINLLLRFYDPQKGKILWDGVDIRTHTLSSLRSQISWVSQENLLFNDTIRMNIAYGNLDANESQVQEAAQIARADEFIRRLPKGYDTVIGEHGCNLSGGERQRITIARAFLKKSPILILDEATSSVDTPTERLIQEAIRELVKGRTTFVIAHRPSTISMATKVILLDKGHQLAMGDHQTLLEEQKLYRSLYRSHLFHLAKG